MKPIHDPYDLSELPPEILARAQHLAVYALEEGLGACVAPVYVSGWALRAHTPGCFPRRPEHVRLSAMAGLYESYAADGVSFLLGSPDEGVFVSATPVEPAVELGQVREKYRVPLEQGERVAEKVRGDIYRMTNVMFLVGSIRRRRPTIADVEFVVLPKDLDEFDRFVRAAGFEAGGKRRKYTAILDGIKVELYVAHDLLELGAMILAYTGDYLFNIAIRSRAKRMGVKLDQYGFWKGKKLVFQSADERDIFDYVGMAWHEPEERSLARRSELGKMIQALLVSGLAPDEREFVGEMKKALKAEKFLAPEEEEALMSLEQQYLPAKAAPAMGSRFALGAEELIELGEDGQRPEPCSGFWSAWQAAYDTGVGNGGRVADVWAEGGPAGGLAIIIQVAERGEVVYYSPYVDRAPSEDDLAALVEDPDLWLCGRLAGPEGAWDWGPVYRTVPAF
jgi:hypothetical protein